MLICIRILFSPSPTRARILHTHRLPITISLLDRGYTTCFDVKHLALTRAAEHGLRTAGRYAMICWWERRSDWAFEVSKPEIYCLCGEDTGKDVTSQNERRYKRGSIDKSLARVEGEKLPAFDDP